MQARSQDFRGGGGGGRGEGVHTGLKNRDQINNVEMIGPAISDGTRVLWGQGAC